MSSCAFLTIFMLPYMSFAFYIFKRTLTIYLKSKIYTILLSEHEMNMTKYNNIMALINFFDIFHLQNCYKPAVKMFKFHNQAGQKQMTRNVFRSRWRR